MDTLSHLVKGEDRRYESLDGHIMERSSQSHMLGTQIPSIQGFGASNFHICHSNLMGQLENFHWKVFEKGMKMHMMSHVKVTTLTTYSILLTVFGELLM